MKYALVLIVLLNLLGPPSLAADMVITYAKEEGAKDHRHEYFLDLLTLALNKVSETPKLQASVITMQQDRAIRQLTQGKGIDIFWTVTSVAREQQLLPIRIPLIKGLLGFRVLIIRKNDAEKFAAVRNASDLRGFVAGQGHDWPDTEILQNNGFNVITSTTYDGLFGMLEIGRFDFFPRGVNEAWQELDIYNIPEFIIDKNIMLYYPSPIYFFVNKENKALAKKIETGLLRAIADGSFDHLFFTHSAHQKMFALAQFEQRVVIPLKNPLLPPLTPLHDEKLWYKFAQ